MDTLLTLTMPTHYMLTWDCVIAMILDADFTAVTEVAVFFFEAQSLWQSDTNENTNALR